MHHTDELTDTWRQRFSFYDTHGLPTSSPQARMAFKELPLWTRSRMTWNTLAFVFCPVYFFVKGMWRKGLVLLCAMLGVAAAAVMLDVPDTVGRAAGFAIPAIAATTANYAYYLHVVMGRRGWNPIEGFGRARRSN